ncbi:hypothetical protein [Kordiimonas pumila]|uniref:DUF4123 domain-containing protein n=1 Tax=Kordiimonas pumila TaxID=2161677 RepID=A0ABV7DAA4_9PROT|nr:hypothetical protein [Kordiimonas pumila]
MPDLFVYGQDTDPDVTSAKAVAQAGVMPLRHIDKQKINITEAELPTADDLIFYFDATQDEGLFPTAVDLLDRKNRSTAMSFMANGSGGEIYRHFFLYPNKPVSVDAFLAATYARVDTGAVSQGFNLGVYRQSARKTFLALMGCVGDTLSRQDIDRVYINVRLTHEKARDIMVNHRFVKTLYPFMEPEVVAASLPLAYRYRQFGRLEAKMNALLNPLLASIPGEYGHSFDEEPSLKYKMRVLESYYRPLWLRRLIPAIRRRIKKPVGINALLGRDLYLIKDQTFPYMQAYFQLDKLNDRLIASRIATLELIAQRFKALR